MTDLLDERHSEARSAARPRRRRWIWIGGAALLLVAAVVLFWFQPQKLFIDERVDEAIPTASPTTAEPANDSATPSTRAAAPAEPVEVSRGEFVSRDHGTSGVVRVLALADGGRVLRVEGLDTDNGPDLYLYFTATPANGDEGAFDDRFLNLGRLKGNQGNQNYDIPADADLDQFPTVVIWCDRFNSAFGAADLSPT